MIKIQNTSVVSQSRTQSQRSPQSTVVVARYSIPPESNLVTTRRLRRPWTLGTRLGVSIQTQLNTNNVWFPTPSNNIIVRLGLAIKHNGTHKKKLSIEQNQMLDWSNSFKPYQTFNCLLTCTITFFWGGGMGVFLWKGWLFLRIWTKLNWIWFDCVWIQKVLIFLFSAFFVCPSWSLCKLCL